MRNVDIISSVVMLSVVLLLYFNLAIDVIIPYFANCAR